MDSSRKLKSTVMRFFNVGEGRARYKTIRKRIVEGANIHGIHVLQLMAAMIIACIGLNLDSTEAIIGAMLICPLMGSVLAISYAVATADRAFLKEAVLGLAVQVIVCLATSALYFVLSPISRATASLETNTNATIWDVMIAFVGGFAGALGTSRKQEPSTLIAGVAVATALMPPLCASGYGIATRDIAVGLSGFYEFLINVVFIAFGAYFVLMMLRLPVHADLDYDGIVSVEEMKTARERSRAMSRGFIVGALLLALPCVFFTAQVIRKAVAENGNVFEVADIYDTELTTMELGIVCTDVTDYRIGRLHSYDKKQGALVESVIATVCSKNELSEAQKRQIERLIRLHVEGLDEVSFEVDASSSGDS